MSDVTVKQFSEVVGVPVDRLLSQLSDAGLDMKDPDDTITDDEKMMLLEHLRKSHGKAEKLTTTTPKQVTLRRKTRTELKVGGTAQGRTGKTVNVEVRKKRTYVKRSVLDEERQRQEAEEKAKLEAERAAAEEKVRAEEEAAARKRNARQLRKPKPKPVKRPRKKRAWKLKKPSGSSSRPSSRRLHSLRRKRKNRARLRKKTSTRKNLPVTDASNCMCPATRVDVAARKARAGQRGLQLPTLRTRLKNQLRR